MLSSPSQSVSAGRMQRHLALPKAAGARAMNTPALRLHVDQMNRSAHLLVTERQGLRAATGCALLWEGPQVSLEKQCKNFSRQ